jgi:condensin complex subunit 1
MLALAKRSVVTDRVDTLLKVGLGPLGKVGKFRHLIISQVDQFIQADLTLARYTCVALQRLNGSAKKIKGL